MDIVEIIRQRHSVRSYLEKSIEQEKVELLNAEVEKINKESGLHFQFVVNEPEAFRLSILSYGKFKNANNYFALVGNLKDEMLDEKVGYYGERLVLKAQELGLNTCWVALTYNKKKARIKVDSQEKVVCVVSVGYGETQGVQHKNKPVDKVCDLKADDPEWFKRGVEMALLAPTAINQQKFFIEKNDNEVLITAGIGPCSKIDLGIVKYHFEMGAGKENFVWKNAK